MGNLYSSMKIFHYKDKVDTLPRECPAILPPVHIRLKPTNICNHNCRYCAYRAEGLQLGRDMRASDVIPRAKLLELVEDFVCMGVQALTFSGGGEPLCHPHLAEAVRALAAGGVQVASLTNGSRLAGEPAQALAEHATWVRVSMDGWDAASYAHYRRVDESEFGRVLGNISAFKGLGGRCRLGVNVIVDQRNAAHLEQLIATIRDSGADSVKLSPCIVSNDSAGTNSHHAPIFQGVKEAIARARQACAGAAFEIYDAYHEIARDFRKDYSWCPYQQVLCVVGADRNVYSCQDKAYNLESGLLGSVRERRFRDFWLEGKDKFFGINPARDCNHHCVADGKNRMILDYLGADPEHRCFV